MRKKGRPNPDQKYFQLIVGLHAETHSGHFPIVSMGSERIIVRASNPGQFDNLEINTETAWATSENGVIYHNGMVGINTDRVEESLVVNGNIKISGQILANSDMRAKQEICELDSREQLKNIQKIRVVRYILPMSSLGFNHCITFLFIDIAMNLNLLEKMD
jgi:myelin regulatory factor